MIDERHRNGKLTALKARTYVDTFCSEPGASNNITENSAAKAPIRPSRPHMMVAITAITLASYRCRRMLVIFTDYSALSGLSHLSLFLPRAAPWAITSCPFRAFDDTRTSNTGHHVASAAGFDPMEYAGRLRVVVLFGGSGKPIMVGRIRPCELRGAGDQGHYVVPGRGY